MPNRSLGQGFSHEHPDGCRRDPGPFTPASRRENPTDRAFSPTEGRPLPLSGEAVRLEPSALDRAPIDESERCTPPPHTHIEGRRPPELQRPREFFHQAGYTHRVLVPRALSRGVVRRLAAARVQHFRSADGSHAGGYRVRADSHAPRVREPSAVPWRTDAPTTGTAPTVCPARSHGVRHISLHLSRSFRAMSAVPHGRQGRAQDASEPGSDSRRRHVTVLDPTFAADTARGST